jgi:hypothetical protein
MIEIRCCEQTVNVCFFGGVHLDFSMILAGAVVPFDESLKGNAKYV